MEGDDPAPPAPGPLTIRAVQLRREDASFFLRQWVVERAPGVVQLEELRSLRAEMDDMLRLQLYFTIKLKFQMQVMMNDPWDELEQHHYLLSPAPWTVRPEADPDQRLGNIIEVARDKLEQHLQAAQLRGSREIIGGIMRVYVLVSPGSEMARLPPAPAVGDQAAGVYHKLPPELESKKCLWSPRTSDNSCFAWCIRAALLGISDMDCYKRKNLARLTDPMLFQEGYAPIRGQHKRNQQLLPSNFGFDFSSLPPPSEGVTWRHIEQFESVNGFRLRIFVWQWMKVEFGGQVFFERHLVREPVHREDAAEHVINLLRHENHYILIWNFQAFMSSQGARLCGSQRTAHASLHICNRCRASFKTQRNLELHQRHPCSFDPSKRSPPIRMPRSEGHDREDIVAYKAGSSAEFAPLVIYMDLEVESLPAPSEGVADRVHCVQETVLSGAYLAVGRCGYAPARRTFLTRRELGEHRFAAVERLLTETRREGERYLLWKKHTNLPPKLSEEEQADFAKATHCSKCLAAFAEGPRMKVCHHEHGTGRFLGSVCKACNTRIVQCRTVPVVLHNGGNFDFRFLMSCASWLRKRSKAGPESSLQPPPTEELDDANVCADAQEEDDGDGDEELPQVAVDETMPEKPWHTLRFSVLFKTGEKILSFRLGCLCFIDSTSFYKASLGSLMDDLCKTSPNDPSRVFRQMAELHPELQPAALTESRRRALQRYFAPDRPFEEIAEEDFKRWTWQLLLRKLPMPFSKMNGPTVWQRPAVWELQAYRSPLNGTSEEQLAKSHKLLRETCEVLGFEDFRRVHDCYLMMDLSLSDVMETFRSIFHARFGVDPIQFLSLPAAAFEAMVKACLSGPGRVVRRVTDASIYACIRETMMGGLSAIFTPHRRANSVELGAHFNKERPTSYLVALDVSSMYPALMQEPLPIDSGTDVELPASRLERVAWLMKLLEEVGYGLGGDERKSYICVVDFSFPLETHDRLDWPPPARMEIAEDQLSPYSRELMQKNGLRHVNSTKLVPFLGAHVNEGVDAKRLAFLVEVLGARIDRVHRIIEFQCTRWLAQWVQTCYAERMELKAMGRCVEAEMMKLTMNAVNGKFMQRCENCRCSQVYSDTGKFVQAANGHRVQDLDFFGSEEDFLGVVQNHSKVIVQKSLVQVAHRVLELSRLMMMRNHYLGIKRLFPQAVPMSTDTDSATYFIETEEDPVLALARANESKDFPCFFDLAKDLIGKRASADVLDCLTERQREIAWRRAGELGAFGMEHLPVRIVEQVGLRSKLYSVLFSGELKGKLSKQRGKGLMKRVMPAHADYVDCLSTGLETHVDFCQMVSHHFKMAVEYRRKKALSPLNTKIWQLDSENGRALGHWRNNQELTALVSALNPADMPFKLIMMFLEGGR